MLLQRKPKLVRTKPSVGPENHGLDIADQKETDAETFSTQSGMQLRTI